MLLAHLRSELHPGTREQACFHAISRAHRWVELQRMVGWWLVQWHTCRNEMDGLGHSRLDGFSGEMLSPGAASCHASGLANHEPEWSKTKVGSSPGFETQLVCCVNDVVLGQSLETTAWRCLPRRQSKVLDGIGRHRWSVWLNWMQRPESYDIPRQNKALGGAWPSSARFEWIEFYRIERHKSLGVFSSVEVRSACPKFSAAHALHRQSIVLGSAPGIRIRQPGIASNRRLCKAF